jgi:hypothetical protein
VGVVSGPGVIFFDELLQLIPMPCRAGIARHAGDLWWPVRQTGWKACATNVKPQSLGALCAPSPRMATGAKAPPTEFFMI